MNPSPLDMVRGPKAKAAAIVKELTGQVPQLDGQIDLGKKVSVPQDLMLEELNLKRNRGSCMYLERQKRVQRYTYEYPPGQINAGSNMNLIQSVQAANGDHATATEGMRGGERYHSEIYIPRGDRKTPPNVPKKTAKVLQMKMCLNPGAIAPGYSAPWKEIPYEKFNSTAIPKSYISPWIEEQNIETLISVTESLPEPPKTPLNVTYRSFNSTPIPFGSLSVLENTNAPTMFEELQAQIEEATSGLELMCKRPSFNRTPRGWAMKFIPETADL
ncbi:myozenin-3 [Xenopus laevis]|uniref:Uncharacterized protein n=2 Tax=Xenopus laevis TaxID=8355 RepID=A0A974HQ96_XENLA|nr:myozenin-3 [Xenopus laevis]OCT86344.1 hypothetical protein XELAEV_18020037mg [Xenopus laevis]